MSVMVEFQARKINGPWTSGYVLDLHTVSSVLIGYDPLGHAQFDTTYSGIGSLLYRLKSRSDRSAIPELVNAAGDFIRSWQIDFSTVVPVPPTRIYRTLQPVLVLATELAHLFKVPILKTAVRKTKEIPELKNVYDVAA
jgi:predicted amidophosphoribosyltransferase